MGMTISSREFCAHVARLSKQGRRYCFILGAGASRSSGILSGSELAHLWYEEIRQIFFSDFLNWKKEKEIDEARLAFFYSEIYKKRFSLDKLEGYKELQKILEKKEPSYGYSVLARILVTTQHKIVITTNFDSLTEDSIFTFTNTKPLVCGHESLSRFVRDFDSRPVIIKIHRDLLLEPKNEPAEISTMDKLWDSTLNRVLQEHIPIVIGYGGNDGSLMKYLSDFDPKQGMFWCYKESFGEPGANIKALVSAYGGQLVKINGFDELMYELQLFFDDFYLFDEFERIAQRRAEKYRTQYQELGFMLSEKGVGPLKKVIKKTVAENWESWWDVITATRATDDILKKDHLFQQGIKLFPDKGDLYAYYADFLHYEKNDIETARQNYLEALKIEPNNARFNNNYAAFEYMTTSPSSTEKARVDRMCQLLETASKADPENSSVICNLASFYYIYKKNEKKAGKIYREALLYAEYNPDVLFPFAKFLIETGKVEEGKRYLDRAFIISNSSPNEYEFTILIIWIIRYAYLFMLYENAESEIEALLSTNVKFPQVIKWEIILDIAKQKNHPDPKKLEVYIKIAMGIYGMSQLNNYNK